jgi:hypothetical protein
MLDVSLQRFPPLSCPPDWKLWKMWQPNRSKGGGFESRGPAVWRHHAADKSCGKARVQMAALSCRLRSVLQEKDHHKSISNIKLERLRKRHMSIMLHFAIVHL